MNMYSATYPELISSAAADRIKRMERAQVADQARKARRSCRARQVQRTLIGWTRLGSRNAARCSHPNSRCTS
jgi:hypothetical protein